MHQNIPGSVLYPKLIVSVIISREKWIVSSINLGAKAEEGRQKPYRTHETSVLRFMAAIIIQILSNIRHPILTLGIE